MFYANYAIDGCFFLCYNESKSQDAKGENTMRKMKTVLLYVLSMLLCVSCLSGCGDRDKVTKDEKFVNVRVFKGGYGADWIYELKDKFEAVYADEGYKVNILTPSYDISGDNVLNELYEGNQKSGVDLYFTANLPVKLVTDGDYGMLVEDLTDTVWNKPAIDFSGKEEPQTVAEKLVKGMEESVTGDDGRRYAFSWVQSIGGMVVNTRKLAQYGLSLPRTTDEMFACFDTIYKGTTYNGTTIGDSETTKTFPITYVQGSNGYTLCMLNAMLAQYEGIAGFNRFWSMQEADGTRMIDNGYEVLSSQGVLEMLTAAFRTFDPKISAYGSSTQDVDQAQAKIMKDGNGAVFMCNGDWMLNEVKFTYKNQLNDIEFINFPVISALGTKLFGPGTGYALDAADCDELLSYIIGLVDENKSLEEIGQTVSAEKGIDVAEADIRAVAEARGLYYSRGVEHVAYIAKDALGKTPAELFLRMYASDDFAKVFIDKSNGSTPYAPASASADTSEYKFVKQAAGIATNRYVEVIQSGATGLRAEMGLTTMFPAVPHIPLSIVGQNISMYDNGAQVSTAEVYFNAAKSMMDSEVDNAMRKWNEWKALAE